MLELRQALRALGRDPLLDEVDLTFSTDAPVSILGLSAPARDLMLRLLSGAEKLKAGEVRLGGQEIARARRAKQGIAQVNSAGAAKTGQKVGKIIEAGTAARVGLSARLAAAVNQLEPEERVRLAIGKAIQDRPALLLLDAPATGLPAEARARLASDLGTMLAEARGVVVLLAGGADEAIGLGGNVVVLSGGLVQQTGPVGDVVARPANLAAAIATAWPGLNTLPMAMDGGRGRLADGSSLHLPEGIGLPAQGGCTLAFRPDDSTLARETPGCMRFVARAVAEERVSGRRYERLTFGRESWLSPLTAAAPPPGVVINVFVDRSKLMAFDAHGAAIRPAASKDGATAA